MLPLPVPIQEKAIMACEVMRFTTTEKARQQSLLNQFRGSILETREFPDRVEAKVDLGRMPLDAIGTWLGLERRCCPFLVMELRLEPRAPHAWISFGGGPEAKGTALLEVLGR